ncbi:putative DNA topoisomerase [Helianthus anomalus]
MCKYLILWLDCDIGGEYIANEVVEVCREVNPYLEIRRTRFSSIYDTHIYNAARDAGWINYMFYDASAEFRRVSTTNPKFGFRF